MVKTQEMFPSHYLHPIASPDAKTFTKKKRKNSPRKAKLRNCFLVEFSGKVAVPGPILLIALLCVHFKSAEGVFIERPKNATVIVNQSTFFNCTISSNQSIKPIWYHHPLVGARQDVYDDRIRDKYKDRFSIDKNTTSGAFNLLVQRPEPTDAGRYQCVEVPLEEDKGPSAELTVLDSNLVCESDKDLNEIVGPMECAKPIAPDQLRLSCIATYSGNFPPQMEWRKVDSELQSNETKCGVRGNRVMCNATLEANLNMDGSVYICQIITAEQYNCSLKVNKTIYTFPDTSVRAVTTTEEVFCSANTSMGLSCLYKWFKDNKTEQSGQTLKPSNPGLYRCEAECTIRNETCAFTAMVINVSEPGNRKLLGLLVLLVIPLVILAALTYYFWKKSRGAKQQQPPQQPINGRPSEEIVLLPVQNDEIDSDDAIRRAFYSTPYIGKGLSGGEIRGPIQHKDMQCTCERITCTQDEMEKAKEQEISNRSQRWMALKHENLITFHDLILQSPAVYIMMEHAAGGSVRDALKKCTKCDVNLPMPVVKDWATQIAQGMAYLHQKDIVHRNLNSVRILVVESIEAYDILNKTLKISQFCLVEDNFTSTHAEAKFSFAAPEVFDGIYGKEGDVWSFGIVIWEMVTRRIPYEEKKTMDKIIYDIRQGVTVLKIPDSCPKALKNILEGCRSVERSERPTFSKIVESLQAWQPDNSPA